MLTLTAKLIRTKLFEKYDIPKIRPPWGGLQRPQTPTWILWPLRGHFGASKKTLRVFCWAPQEKFLVRGSASKYTKKVEEKLETCFFVFFDP